MDIFHGIPAGSISAGQYRVCPDDAPGRSRENGTDQPPTELSLRGDTDAGRHRPSDTDYLATIEEQ